MAGSPTLYDLGTARGTLEAAIELAQGDLSPEAEAQLDALDLAIDLKIERVALFARELLTNADGCRAEGERLIARANTQTKAANSLKGYLKTQLERLGRKKVKGLLADVRIQVNSAPTVSITLGGAELYALLGEGNRFVQPVTATSYPIDRAAIVAAWEAKEELPAAISVELHSHIRIQ